MITSRRNLRQIIGGAWRGRRRVVADQRGVTAVEFGLLAVPFFGLVAVILETALTFLAIQVLDSAVHDSSRLIRTGQAQSYTPAAYREAICDRLFGLFDCDGVKVRVTPVGTFTAAATTDDVVDEDDGTWQIVETYSPGGSSAVVIVEAYYKWPTYLDFFGVNFASLPDGTLLMGSVRVFRNEPF